MEKVIQFESPVGGVMTVEAGAITGELLAMVRVSPDGQIQSMVAYAETNDWYQVEGGADISIKGAEDETASEILLSIVERLSTDPGIDEYGNAIPSTLAEAS